MNASEESVAATPPKRYDPSHMKPVRDYIKNCFGARYEDEIQVWGPPEEKTHAWQTGTEHNVTANFVFEGDVCAADEAEEQAQRWRFGDLKPEQIDKNPNPFNQELRYAGVFAMKAVAGVSSYPVFTTYRTRFAHPAFEKAIHQQNREQVALGGIAGTAMHLNPCMDKERDLDVRFLNPGGYHFMNPEVVRTLANITPENLMNGIIMIPRRVCIEAYHEHAFPVYRPQEPDLGESETLQDKLLFWYFVPLDHVLAWPLNIPPVERMKRRYNILEYRFKARKSRGGEQHLLGLLVCNNTLNKARNSFLARMLGRAYLSDLRDLDLEMIPNYKMRAKTPQEDALIKRDAQRHQGVASVRVRVGYYLFKSLTGEELRNLCPTVSPGFPANTQPVIPVPFGPVTAPEDAT